MPPSRARRRRPGQRLTSTQVIARATVWAAGVVLVAAAAAGLALPTHRLSITVGAAIAVGLNLLSLIGMVVVGRYFSDAQAAGVVISYVVKLLGFAVCAFALKNSGLDVRMVVGVLVISLVASLAVFSYVSLRKSGPFVGDQ
ncbi:hypothetical protein [Trueperella pecoris]|uniref:ATP synthase protein I n=1 Tax=Trueperella pecoris TaxID=2733571 RepID=A0A7M1QVG6_9ACTO|nr:hypothetical protein [Trueperella pecoris]QOQ39243.1 hypothetical protein HLG82_07180 [Trueperella pecoris]QOR46122.1 hypothetical protein INS88_02590 [Trueperella pecoris]QTG75946.1 hypothetical protein J4179_02485 [Trueperella pecoris]